MIDRQAIGKLFELASIGNKNLVKDLISLFKQESVSALQTFRILIETEDYVSASRLAHHLKSSCANLGAHKMQAIAEKIEKLNTNGRKDVLIELVDGLEAEYFLAIAELKKMTEL